MKNTFCVNCGTENKENAIYCSLCQEPLQRFSQETVNVNRAEPSTHTSPHTSTSPEGATTQRGILENNYERQGPNFYPTQPEDPSKAYGATISQSAPDNANVAHAYLPVLPYVPVGFAYVNPPAVVTQTKQTPGEATASLVLGIMGLLFCPLICSLLAIIFGVKAKNMIDASGGYLGGRGVAQAGLIMGVVGMALYTVGTILYMILLAAAGSSSGLIPFL